MVEFAKTPIVLQSPTTDHALTRAALGQLHTSGGTAIGDAIQTSLREIRSLPVVDGKHPPGAILLISDGASNVGSDPIAAAREAASLHIPIYTVALGTYKGTIPITQRRHDGHRATCRRARRSLRRSQAPPAGRRSPPLTRPACARSTQHLAAKLGHKTVKQQITASFAGVGLVLLLVGSVLTLRWFGRLI